MPRPGKGKIKLERSTLSIMQEGHTRQFRVATIKQLFVSSAFLLVQMIIFFVAAGSIAHLQPWFFFGTAFAHYSVSTLVQYKLNPRLLVQRLKRKREGSKAWDEILMRVSNLTVIILIPATAGLDVGRFQWSHLDLHFAPIGLVFIIISTILLNWAMVVNPHFEPTVRIQEEHTVITSGPYQIVRHPGYLAGILFALSIPPMIGSVYAFIPAGIYVLLTIARTWLEDHTLQEELPGYTEYTKRSRFRLLPGIW